MLSEPDFLFKNATPLFEVAFSLNILGSVFKKKIKKSIEKLEEEYSSKKITADISIDSFFIENEYMTKEYKKNEENESIVKNKEVLKHYLKLQISKIKFWYKKIKYNAYYSLFLFYVILNFISKRLTKLCNILVYFNIVISFCVLYISCFYSLDTYLFEVHINYIITLVFLPIFLSSFFYYSQYKINIWKANAAISINS